MVITGRILKLGDVLLKSENFEWNYALFMARDEKWTLDSMCAVLDPNDVEDDAEEEPKFAQENNLKYILGIQVIQDIVDNARQQNSCCTDMDLFKAFLFYFDNDAFIEF